MRTDRGFDRLVNFSDAVVAIALTLLVLPLANIPENAREGEAVATMLRQHTFELVAFALSFVVISVLWRAHHQLFEHLQDYDATILRLNQLWLLTIIVLPFNTELLNRVHASSLANGLYVGALLISSLCLAGIASTVRRRPALRHPDSAADPESRLDDPQWISAIFFAIALVLVTTIPSLNMWPLLTLLLAEPVRTFMRRRRVTATATTAA